MISTSVRVSPAELEQGTGWHLQPVGLCREDRCVPLPAAATAGGSVDLGAVAERLGCALLHDEQHGLWSLGPESGGHALASAVAPDLVLPTLDGEPFPLSRLRGTKVLIAAWASW